MKPWSYEPAGRLEEHSVTSELLRDNLLGDPHERPLWVYVPPGYSAEPERRYPSLYVIQGFTGQLDMWKNRSALRKSFPELLDDLFAAGCGRLFEGTPAMMYESLNVTLGALPDGTRVYCGHEYTQNNLRFAEMLEPSNVHVKEKAARVAEQRKRGEPSVPSTLGSERLTNPFLRCDSAELVHAVAARLSGDRSPAAILGAVRAAKDAF